MAAVAITDAMLEKIVLMDVATFGIIAPAATATKPAISAYSIRSWPRVSRKTFNVQSAFVNVFNCVASSFHRGV